jgi:hypothetical protein
MQQTIEQFSNELLDRWKELHPECKKVKEESKKTKGLLTYPPITGVGDSKVVDDEKVPIEIFNRRDGISEAVFNRAKKKLRDPITWVGPIAVGEEKNLRGWWAAVLPDSTATISFFGPLARKRAIEKAELLKKEYE